MNKRNLNISVLLLSFINIVLGLFYFIRSWYVNESWMFISGLMCLIIGSMLTQDIFKEVDSDDTD